MSMYENFVTQTSMYEAMDGGTFVPDELIPHCDHKSQQGQEKIHFPRPYWLLWLIQYTTNPNGAVTARTG